MDTASPLRPTPNAISATAADWTVLALGVVHRRLAVRFGQNTIGRNPPFQNPQSLRRHHTIGGGPARTSRLPAWFACETTPSCSIRSISEAARL